MGTTAFTFRVTNNQELIVDAIVGAHTRVAQASFDSSTHTISYGSRGHFKPHVDDAGNFSFRDDGTSVNVEEMGQKLIDDLTSL